LHNKTNQLWTLRPVIDGEFWSGGETLIVEPQQSKNYEIIYRPLTMTQDSKKHSVSSHFFSILYLSNFHFFFISRGIITIREEICRGLV